MNLTPAGDLRFVVDHPFALIRAHLKPFLAVALVGALASSVPNGLSQIGAAINSADPMNLSKMPLTLLLTYSGAFLSIAVLLAVQLSVAEAIRAALDGEPIHVGGCWRVALSPKRYGGMAIKWGIFFISLCLCGLPILYLGLVLAPLAAILVHEERGAFAGVGRAFALCHGGLSFWGVMKRLLFIVILWHAVYGVLSAVTTPGSIPAMIWLFTTGLEQAMSGATAGMAMPAWLTVATVVVQIPATALGFLYSGAVFTLLYRDLRDSTEGHDLSVAIQARIDASRG